MPWAKLDDQFPGHPKILGLSDAAFRLHVAGICYCAQRLTDGLIASEAVPLLVPRYKAKTLVELVERGLWYDHREAHAYEIHDYRVYNPPAVKVRAERERKSKGGRLGAERRWHGDGSSHG